MGNIATTRRLTDTTGNLTTSRLPSLAVLSQASSVGDVKHHKEVSKIGLDEHKAATLMAFRKAIRAFVTNVGFVGVQHTNAVLLSLCMWWRNSGSYWIHLGLRKIF